MLMISINLLASDLYVLPGAGSAPGYYNTIQEAVDAAEDGDVILISPQQYVEEVSIAYKSISLQSFTADQNFEIVGDLRFKYSDNDDAGTPDYIGFYEVTISNLTINGKVTYYNYQPVNEIFYILNFIDCEFYDEFDTGSQSRNNVYYSSFFSDGNKIFHCEDFIGNNINPINMTGDYVSFNFKDLQMGALLNNDHKVNIHGNKFINSQLYFYPSQDCYSSDYNSFTNQGVNQEENGVCDAHYDIRNNVIHKNTSNTPNQLIKIHNQYAGSKKYSYEISNNTLINADSGDGNSSYYNQGKFLWFYGGNFSLINFANNICLISRQSSYHSNFYFSGNFDAIFVQNNLFNLLPSGVDENNLNSPEILSTSNNSSNGSIYSGSVSNYTIIHEGNIFMGSQFNQYILDDINNFTELEGIPGLLSEHGVPELQTVNWSPYYSDKGLDLIEYRDIDNTVNNIGPDGGPHSVWNYFSPSGSDNSYKARVIGLEIPSTIYGLPGVSGYEFKSKAIITNE